MNKKEIWKPITGYEGKYEVSNYGRVKSLSRLVNRNDGKFKVKSRIRKPQLNGGGGLGRKYHLIKLHKGGNWEFFYVHRLVCQEFKDKDLDGMHVHHIDGNHTNNVEWNLKVVTQEEHVLLHRKEILENFDELVPLVKKLYDNLTHGDIIKFRRKHNLTRSNLLMIKKHLDIC